VTLHTSLGDLKLEVHCDLVPRAAENFLALCASGYYNGSLFNRVIRGFIAQAGAPAGRYKGGEAARGGTLADQFVPGLGHGARGVVSYASSGPDTNGSQFFVTLAKQPQLDNSYTVFGKVIDGWATLDKIEAAQVAKKDRPVEEIVITSVTIHANPIADMEVQ
jgi:peptidyl-prolyl cis-trans isomerase-like 3